MPQSGSNKCHPPKTGHPEGAFCPPNLSAGVVRAAKCRRPENGDIRLVGGLRLRFIVPATGAPSFRRIGSLIRSCFACRRKQVSKTLTCASPVMIIHQFCTPCVHRVFSFRGVERVYLFATPEDALIHCKKVALTWPSTEVTEHRARGAQVLYVVSALGCLRARFTCRSINHARE